MRVAIVGAGLAGLTAARVLRGAGLAPVVFDKGRGPGGRLSTRRAGDGLQFDHGAQYLSPRSPDFATFLDEAAAAGAAARWDPGDGRPRIVGLPGMSGIAKHLAAGTDVRTGVEVTEITRDGSGCQVAGESFDRVICTVPAPQAARLLAAVRGAVEVLETVEMEPNLTLMLAHPARPRPFVTRREEGDDIAWLALDSTKHDRPGPDCWVAQASAAWSRAHLERDKDEIAALMLPMVCDRLGLDRDAVIHAAGHRWRYARASVPLGPPFWSDGSGLFVGGDWALSDRADGAWQSGRAMAQTVLETG